MESGDIIEQKCWQYIRDVNGDSDESLDRIALTDCRRDYTYRSMYGMWERYARVFSALDITWKSGARAGLEGVPCAEVSFAFFGLNMTGASVSVIKLSDEDRLDNLKKQIEKDHITDLILTDFDANVRFIKRLLKEKDSMGIRNVILLHVPVCGDFAFPWEEMKNRIDHRTLRETAGVLYMDDLMKEYADRDICYAKEPCDEAAVVIHTSGTTEGVPKPVPLSDRALNESLRRHSLCGKTAPKGCRMTSLLFNSMSAGSSFIGMLTPLANGGKLVTLPTVTPGLRLFFAAGQYRATNLVMFSALLDLMIMLPLRPDLSSVQTVLLVGSFTSAEGIRKCREFFRQCGSDANILVGYGLSEAGVGLTLTDSGSEDDSVGYLLPGVKAKFFDEDTGRFNEIDGKEYTGVLFVSTPSLSCGCLDDDVLFELDDIAGEKYLNTNDLFNVKEDGALYYLGRANRFFLDSEGVRFDAGLVERAMSAQKGIKGCGLAPQFNKTTHDTEPVLYVETDRPGICGYRIVKDALEEAYIRDGLIDKTELPVRCVITGDIPRNMNGKVDVRKITEGRIYGSAYSIEGIYEGGRLKAIEMEPCDMAPDSPGCECFAAKRS